MDNPVNEERKMVEEPQFGDLVEIVNPSETRPYQNRGYSVLAPMMYVRGTKMAGLEWLDAMRCEGYHVNVFRRNGTTFRHLKTTIGRTVHRLRARPLDEGCLKRMTRP